MQAARQLASSTKVVTAAERNRYVVIDALFFALDVAVAPYPKTRGGEALSDAK